MNVLRMLSIALVLFLGMSYTASAQGILSPEQQQEVAVNVEQFITEINLSEQDKPQFRMILGEFFLGLVVLRATHFPTQTNRKIFQALKKGRDSRMKELLSKEQYKVYKTGIKTVRTNLIDFMEQQAG